jgi:hypothetical protein
MSGACSTDGRDRDAHRGNLRESDYLLDLGVDGSVILKWVSKKVDGGVGGILLVQDRDS